MLVRSLHKKLALGWLFTMLLAALYLVQVATQRPLLRTDIMSFLPQENEQQEIQQAVDRFSQRNSQKLILLLSATTTDELLQAAGSAVDSLADSNYWTLLPGVKNAGDVSAMWRWYQSYAGVLLSADDRTQLSQKKYDDFLRDIVLGYVNPIAMSGGLLSQDPLFLLQNFLTSRQGADLNVRNVDGWPVLVNKDGYALVLPFSTYEDVYDLTQNAKLTASVYAVRNDVQQKFPAVHLSLTGPLLHIFHSVEQSEREVSVVGTGSMIGIFLLFLWWLRSLFPLVASLLVLVAGMLLAFTVTVAVFGSVHLIALVFCSTVMGLGIDYSLHYFAHRSANASTIDSLQLIVVPTGLGMVTSALAFLALAWVPFPGFRQVALMSALGLLFVWISTVLWLPYFARSVAPRMPINRSGKALIQVLLNLVFSRVGILVGLLLSVLLATGLLKLKANDDIRQLQAVFPPLKMAEVELQKTLNQRLDTAYFLVQGEDAEQVLSRMESLCGQLRVMSVDTVSSEQCLSDWLPSLRTQRQNNALLRDLNADAENVWLALEALGLQTGMLTDYRQTLSGAASELTPDAFWQSPVAGRFQSLWLGEQQHKTAAVVLVAGVRNPVQMLALASSLSGVYWVDQVGRFSAMFKHFRQQGGLFVLMSYCILLGLLSLRYGVRGAVGILGPVLLAVLVVLGVAGIAGLPFNLFSVLALILVAGMGIDYGIFLRESDGASGPTLTAIVMSAITTLLAFGLLALSKTNAISSFGQVVLIGISVVLFSTLLAHSKMKKDNDT